jgi:16S rRNA (guanine966-N2)-methyltransferase
MTRIVAGDAGGIRLEVPSSGTRPTSEVVRESLFNALDAAGAIEGARALDLYAGSGAIGLEALSRGAASAEFVEKFKGAAAVIRKNAAKVSANIKREHSVKVHEVDARTFLNRASGPYDLVFSDPPYDVADSEVDAYLVALAPHLAPGAIVILERDRRAANPDFAAAGLTNLRTQMYGDTVLNWAQAPSAD